MTLALAYLSLQRTAAYHHDIHSEKAKHVMNLDPQGPDMFPNLPTKVIVQCLELLGRRDLVKILYLSRRFRDVMRENGDALAGPTIDRELQRLGKEVADLDFRGRGFLNALTTFERYYDWYAHWLAARRKRKGDKSVREGESKYERRQRRCLLSFPVESDGMKVMTWLYGASNGRNHETRFPVELPELLFEVQRYSILQWRRDGCPSRAAWMERVWPRLAKVFATWIRTCDLQGRISESEAEEMVRVVAEPNWDNLWRWCWLHYHGIVLGIRSASRQGRDAAETQLILGSMFSLVKALRGRPWSIVENELFEHRPALIEADARWA